LAFIGVGKTPIMNFKFLIISIAILSGFAGSAFAEEHIERCLEYTDGVCTSILPEVYAPIKEYSQEEIDEMKSKAVQITMNGGTFLIEFFPEDAPNTVHNFLKLVESGYYDGIVFHRIIPGFMIQTGDPNTKDPDSDRETWGQGGPGYQIKEEFNTIQHDRGIVSMARSNHPDSAGSQFFIMLEDSPHLDGQYTAFGRLIPGIPSSFHTLDLIEDLGTDASDRPTNLLESTILTATILDPYTTSGLVSPDRNQSVIVKEKREGGIADHYYNSLHKVAFDLPYRWSVIEATGSQFGVIMEPTDMEHNVKAQVEKSGFVPKVIVTGEKRDPREDAGVSTAFFSVEGGDDPKILGNYVFENEDGRKAILKTTTQDLETPEGTVEFKILQLSFINSEYQYSIIYVNVTEWFRYELSAFLQTVGSFEIMIDGQMQPINFDDGPIFKQLIADAKAEPEPESLPPVRIGGCLIATATYGSELAPQVQLLREIRDNTVLQTQSGISFMTAFNQFYYSFSPAIADYERENIIFKETVKLTLTPLLVSLTLLQHADIDSEYDMLGYGIGIILLNIGMYFVAPAVLITKIRSFYKLQ
jgi:peptidyl-prolyl cis-trans isomerase B (cyclophilin B)